MRSTRDEQVLDAYQLGRSSVTGWNRSDCPFCIERIGKEDDDQSFGIQEGTGAYHCFKCKIKGRLKNPPEWFPIDELFEEMIEYVEEFDPPPFFEPLYLKRGLTSSKYADARQHLIDRGLPDTDLWAYAELGACLRGRMFGRVVAPIRTETCTWTGYVGRDFTGDSKAKYLYPRDMDRHSQLYEQFLLNDEEDDRPLLIVEGVFDALPYFGRACAVLGKPTDEHVQTIVQTETQRRIAVALDGDAWSEGESLAYRLRLHGVNAQALRLPPKEDPGSMALDYGKDCFLDLAMSEF